MFPKFSYLTSIRFEEYVCCIGETFGPLIEALFSVVNTKVKLAQAVSSSGAGSVLAETGPGILKSGADLIGQIIQVCLIRKQ